MIQNLMNTPPRCVLSRVKRRWFRVQGDVDTAHRSYSIQSEGRLHCRTPRP